ncbi:sialic acid synthase [Humidesulfovibrio mexicanus]|uniref:Sialic acid synthase n=1 Tax=Humidesulfovibrio mexicanus TaxID=147047 RepID=A0A238YA66_9BACT|nr:N-acetylneuraminate synthase family protein [Humidesulfovibrio mexicanus]SNR67920.1 sialic acid synthase [Humidesulfovibrio mexicanus]
MAQVNSITLPSGRAIGQGHPCFIVAEVGNNHQGDMAQARRMVQEAARAGVDAVKFQKRHMESLLTRAGREAPYTGANSFGPTYGAHRKALELSVEQMAELKELTESLGLVFFASAWDEVSLEEMLGLGMQLIKICSADLVNVPLVRKIAASGLPIIMSTGMSTLEEVDAAVSLIRQRNERLVLLHCNSSYPCAPEQIGLPVMEFLRERYGLPVGYSGHERGLAPSVASVALGACVVERHFTLDKNQVGTDHKASLEPAELAELVAMIREVEACMIQKGKKVFPEEQAAAKKLRKCMVFSRDLPAGHVLTPADLTTRSPLDGISPVHWDEVLGAAILRSVKHEEPLQWEHLALPVRHASAASQST